MTVYLLYCHHRSHRPQPLAISFARSQQRSLPRRGMERLDLLLLAIEALDLHGSEAMLWSCEQLELQQAFPDRVALWKSRCRNPLRRASRRGEWTAAEQQGLIQLVCSLSQRLYPMLRQLLSSGEPDELSQQRWALFAERYNDLIGERMNLKRGAVRQLLDEKSGAQRRREVVQTLAFCAGGAGMQRLETSLMDGNK